ncbi:MAG: MOSC domain-containing protein [Actinomycetota bacterium]
MGLLRSVNVVHALIPDVWGSLEFTAIDKRPVTGRVVVGPLGVAGDSQYDTEHHGGVDQAVYAYADEDREWWAAELSRELGPGAFGENLTTSGIDVTNAVVGERWRIGTVTLQVRTPRIPCRTFAGFWQVDALEKRFTAHGASGAYLSVVEAGELAAGEPIEVVHRPAHGLTIGDIFSARSGDRARVALLADVDDATDKDRNWARRVLGVPAPASG